MSALNDPRVLFAAERTLLAWNRTSLALIAFGFLVERSGLVLSLLDLPSAYSGNPRMILAIGLAFIVTGLFAAVYSSRQFISFVKTLGASDIPRGYATNGALILNGAVALLGAALAAVLYFSRT